MKRKDHKEIEKTKLPKEWEEAFCNYESITGFEPMHLDAIRSGEMTIREAWRSNIRWFEDVYAGVQNIRTPGLTEKEIDELLR